MGPPIKTRTFTNLLKALHYNLGLSLDLGFYLEKAGQKNPEMYLGRHRSPRH